VVIDGQTYSNAWIAANPAEVAKYINANPASAATILQNVDSNTRASVLEAYNRQSGTTYTVDTGMAALNQTVATTTTPSNLVTIGNQAYTNDWIIAHPREVATYIDQHPAEALSIIEKLSPASQAAIVKAYNQANKTNYTVSAGLAVLKQVNTNTASTV
jgi:ABC-type nitrate/sulfonate/bicarbonate transport system substrate-binding protein